jgi:hypothetical protein
MKNYMAVFLGAQPKNTSWDALDPETRKKKEAEGMEAWNAWGEKYKDSVVDFGSPLGKTKKIDKNGISDIQNEMAAWTIVKAESYEEAAKMFINHPHFAIFPGDRVEVMECLPMPKM